MIHRDNIIHWHRPDTTTRYQNQSGVYSSCNSDS